MYTKSPKEVEQIIEGGKLLGAILEELASMVAPGVTGADLDEHAESRIREVGGIPSFKGFRSGRNEPPFPSCICFSINDEIVHGIASVEKVMTEGDIVSIDIGMQWPANSGQGQDGNGFFTDTAVTVPVGEIAQETKHLLAVTQKSLYKGIAAATVDGSIADIGKTVEEYIQPQGYGIVRDLVGHGVGHGVHEDPRVPNYYDKELEAWKIRDGVVIAIEPMITVGDYRIKVADDGWSISTRDGSLSAHFEHTVVVTNDGPVIATKRPSENV